MLKILSVKSLTLFLRWIILNQEKIIAENGMKF